MISCSLCQAAAHQAVTVRSRVYYRCSCCRALLLDPAELLDPLAEKERYDQHNNDINDCGYQNFIRPLVDQVIALIAPLSKGLDYGAGPGPVATHLLQQEGYDLKSYDPYYWPDQNTLLEKYDFIICSEVIEHFYQPGQEFLRLQSLLQPQGVLFCMTEIIEEQQDLAQWPYLYDPTHVFLYAHETFHWIATQYNFTYRQATGRIAIFTA